ncbi:MAG: type III secretion system chaperone [Chlamydiae bacterium GWC2_50_10]|nr:MAG: type III secretion system chaperone [Chlamydiae bacterium GWA2_50_15]OGN54372.1 MAG: type III secretion system chaperone [Chlamydiae bacterium GWC2_50_10]OGN57533.1 MAG: type III secretion system chaperone [Chlamydiae bacterium RIFCSPHIGHO2_02_FULL_49_29]OGN63942.1 MAG: type III secretion system chaperone [Chlamydiae bacterium RIFCSPHIGHO2_12_FULL_49_32]OGN68554.1 MAG: type III secretion system chaperone [Chlamydiae bacterium RIFCSPLOWO2_02_FULL_49_12]HAZ16013.1 Tir chaperone family pr
MSFENAKQNLKEFGKELNLEGLAFDENNTCILGIDNTFSLHLTYEPNSDRLYLYSPILDGLPKDDKIRLKLYEDLLQGSMLGGQMAGGGIGVAVPEELILMHSIIDMGVGTDASALRRFAPIFVDAVEKWRDRTKLMCEGKEVPALPRGPQQPGKVPGAPPPPMGGPGGVPGFKKV